MDDKMKHDSNAEDSSIEIEPYEKACTLHISRQRLPAMTPGERKPRLSWIEERDRERTTK